MSRLVSAGSLLLLLGACAFQAGNGFAKLEAGELHAAIDVDGAAISGTASC